MTEHTNFAERHATASLKRRKKELIAFERREREFTERQKKERAAELQLPVVFKNELNS